MTQSIYVVPSPKNGSKSPATPIIALSSKQLGPWLKQQPVTTQKWVDEQRFTAAAGKYCLLPDKNGTAGKVLCGLGEGPDTWGLAHLPAALPHKNYRLEGDFTAQQATQLALGWAVACYHFNRYKSKKGSGFATLVAPKNCDFKYVKSMAEATNFARDLINTPTNDMLPDTLADIAASWGRSEGAAVSVLKGEALLKANYPTVYAVGKASRVPAHLVDLRFPKKGAPKVTLIGKGVCFDSGGLDIKSSSNMKLMKKDMAGVAIMLGLARTLRTGNLNIELRLILPMVENAVGGNAMRPMDIIKTRSGITVEVGNTDAEGRLILCDALFEADSEKPDLLIDCATLTGAARVALGTDMPAFFTNDDELAAQVSKHSMNEHDPMWRLPLWKPYRTFLNTPNADISNDPDSAYGGAITAALYLQEFVSKTPSWLHIDMMAWNLRALPGRPVGGEAMAMRALHALIKERYGN